MRKIEVRDVSPVENVPEGTIILCGDLCFERMNKDSRTGEFIDFTDETGKVCRLYVREFGKIPHGQTEERRRW